MVTEFIIGHESMCSIFLFGIVSILIQMIMVLSLNSYVKASANMKTTKKKILLNLKNQFETIYGMDYQVRNTYAYVEKYLLKLKFMGVSYSAWEKVPFLAAGILTLLAGGEAFYQYMSKKPTDVLVEIGFSYGITLVCFFVFFHIFGIKNKKEQVQIQLVDYLENYLANRLIRTRNGEKEYRVLNESMEEAFMDEAVDNDRIRKEILIEEKERSSKEENPASQVVEEDCKENEGEEDMDMLRRLVKEMEHKEDSQKQIAVSEEDPNLALLEEFVQSFLA